LSNQHAERHPGRITAGRDFPSAPAKLRRRETVELHLQQ
jgi:hypothetical protein